MTVRLRLLVPILALAILPGAARAATMVAPPVDPKDGTVGAVDSLIFGGDEPPRAGPASFTFAADLPEPAAWTMMIAGFGLVGAMARRRPPRPA